MGGSYVPRRSGNKVCIIGFEPITTLIKMYTFKKYVSFCFHRLPCELVYIATDGTCLFSLPHSQSHLGGLTISPYTDVVLVRCAGLEPAMAYALSTVKVWDPNQLDEHRFYIFSFIWQTIS